MDPKEDLKQPANSEENANVSAETNEEAPNKRVISSQEGSTKELPGDWQIGNKGPLTPERAAEGDRQKSDAV